MESLRLVEGETRCDGWLELAIESGAWRRVPGEILVIQNLSNVCGELECGGLDKGDAIRGTVELRQMNDTERAIMRSVIKTIENITTEESMRGIPPVGFGPDFARMTTAPAAIPHGAFMVCSGGCPGKGWRCRFPGPPAHPGPSVPTGSRRVRLVGGSGRCAGRVEVYSGGSWSSVCQEGWELQDAGVVCRELGCGRALEAPRRARFGAGAGPLWPHIPECSGSEESLWECGRSQGRECRLGGGAGAVCSGECRAVPAEASRRAGGFLAVP